MPLKAIVARLGGDLYDGGRRANVPAPGHSPDDRSVSLLALGDRVLIHSFGGADWRDVRDQLRNLNLLPDCALQDGLDSGVIVAARSSLARRLAAQRIWDAGQPLARTLSERHCRLRGIEGPLPGASVLRHGAETPISAYRPTRATRPALLAALQDPAGELAAVEITYLAPSGRRADRIQPSRKLVGTVPAGSAVRLSPSAPAMLVAEGVFTTLSAARRFALPGWALTSAGNLRRWRAPAGVRRVLIAADRGAVGEAAAEDLRRALLGAGVLVEVALPPPPHGDWNEAQGAGWAPKERGRAGLGASEQAG